MGLHFLVQDLEWRVFPARLGRSLFLVPDRPGYDDADDRGGRTRDWRGFRRACRWDDLWPGSHLDREIIPARVAGRRQRRRAAAAGPGYSPRPDQGPGADRFGPGG